jgi:hypothetical protein
MLFQSLRVLCKAPGEAGCICENLEVLAKATRMSGWFTYGFLTELDIANVVGVETKRWKVAAFLFLSLGAIIIRIGTFADWSGRPVRPWGFLLL